MRFAYLLLPLFAIPAFVEADQPDALARPSAQMAPREGLVLPPVGQGGRLPVHKDALEAEIVAGRWLPPKAGDVVAAGNAKAVWRPMTAQKDGTFREKELRGGYAYFNIPSDKERVMMLEAAGHALVYVNGEPRAGDLYSHGYVKLPVLLHKGDNHFLFLVGRGQLKWQLAAPPKDVFLAKNDMLLPDGFVSDQASVWAAVLVVNATTERKSGLSLTSANGEGWVLVGADVMAPMPPLSVRKVPVKIAGPAKAWEKGLPVKLQLCQKPGVDFLDTLDVHIQVRTTAQPHIRTFISGIDGSVQYYAVLPAKPLQKNGPALAPALFLSLHGASVEATGQAAAYAAKTWGHLIAPTNRRPYGFDWEDWGRLDALEVLAHAQEKYGTDPQRVYLTGHSMGGHGTWHVGATFPDRFAAIGPSAGWVSFWSYAGAARIDSGTPVQALLQRATNTSDTLALAKNYLHHGVYVLHGDADDNVPVGQARIMKKHLEPFHHDLHYFEQPKAGHWWSNTDEPGAACVDWAPMFDLFARRVIPRPEQIREIGFITANPGVSAWCHWVGIVAQEKALDFSSIQIRFDPVKRRFVATTKNVAVLAIDLNHVKPGENLSIELDGNKLEKVAWPKSNRLYLERHDNVWLAAKPPPARSKGPHRYGPFRDAFNHHMLFVYGTKGNAAENAWALAKARFDAETFWYRGNGSIEVIADVEFDAKKTTDRSVILYGNADTNGAWTVLLKDSPVQVKRGAATVGGRMLKGDDLACLFLRPRPDSDVASVGVLAGSGLAGMRLTDRLPIFVSGVGYPDCTVLGPDVLTEGFGGVLAAGFFGIDWSIDAGDFAWRDQQ
jgi:dienelactone hydrolase